MPSFSRGTVDITNHGTTDFWEQCISGGPVRTGSVGISAVFLTTASEQTVAIPADFLAGSRSGFKIEIAGTSSDDLCWYGNGYITSYNVTVPAEGMCGFDMTMKLTGAPVISTSTGS
jgi:predicted secreted protein